MRLYKLIEGMARPTIPAGLSPEMNKYLHDLDDYLRRLGQKLTTANISGDVDTDLITNFTTNVTTIVNSIVGGGGGLPAGGVLHDVLEKTGSPLVAAWGDVYVKA
jgi:hypothetical protein